MSHDDAVTPLSLPAPSLTPALPPPSAEALGTWDLLLDPDPTRVLAAATEMLRTGYLDPLKTVITCNAGLKVCGPLLRLLGSIPLAAAGELLWEALLSDHGEPGVNTAALAALADRHGLPELGASLRRSGFYGSYRTVHGIDALGALGDPRAVRLLRQALEDGLSDAEQHHMIAALRSIGGDEAIDVLVLCLEDAGEAIRSEARATLVSFGAAAVPRLLEALADGDDERMRREAACALGQLRAAKAIPLLLEVLPMCFDIAVQALARIGPAGLEALARQELDEEEFEKAAHLIAGLGTSVRSTLIEVLLRRPRSGLARYAFQQLHDA